MDKVIKGVIRYFVITNLVMGTAFVGLVAVGGTAYMINHGTQTTQVNN